MSTVHPPPKIHLQAGAIAVLLTLGLLALGSAYCHRLEKENIREVAADFSLPKLQGAALQKHAFEAKDLLVLYGSSELQREVTNNATQFFQDYPTGFRVFAVGQPGTTALAVLQKVAAAGESVRGRKVAYSISPGVYIAKVWAPEYYEGNFSAMQAYELVFSTKLSRRLKRDIARRMLDFPKTLADEWLLEFAVERLADDTVIDRFLYAIISPLGRLRTIIGRGQDHFQSTVRIHEVVERDAVPTRSARRLDWKTLVQRAASFANRAAVESWKQEAAGRSRKKFNRREIARKTRTLLRKVTLAREWIDLELLLRTFQELGAEPLLLSMPMEDVRLENYGVTAEARTAYLQRMRRLADKYQVHLIDFEEHQADAAFVTDFNDHLSPKGWIYYNKALDDFYHGRLP